MTGDEIDYAGAVWEMQYPPRYVPAVVASIQAQRRSGGYPGFRAALRNANVSLHVASAFQEIAVEPVIRRIEVLEAGGAAGRRSSPRSTTEIVEEALATIRARESTASARQQAQTWLLLDMTDDELEGRARLRPAIAERWVERFPDRPLIEGRLPTARQLERLEELEDRRQADELRKMLGLAAAGKGVSEDTSAGAYSQAAATGRAETDAALTAFFGSTRSAAEEARLARIRSGEIRGGGWWAPPDPDADPDLDTNRARPNVDGV
jgi:hypothetical protein